MLKPVEREPQPELSPARDALARHLADENFHRDRLEKFRALQQAAHVASVREAEAVEGLAAVGHAEQRDFDRWSQTLEGAPPSPRREEREIAARALADARSEAAEARRAADAVSAAAMEAAKGIATLKQDRDLLVGEVLVEAARDIAIQYEAAVEATALLEAHLGALRRQLLFKMQLGGAAERVSALMRGSALPGELANRLRPARAAILATIETFAAAVATNPHLTIEDLR